MSEIAILLSVYLLFSVTLSLSNIYMNKNAEFNLTYYFTFL